MDFGRALELKRRQRLERPAQSKTEWDLPDDEGQTQGQKPPVQTQGAPSGDDTLVQKIVAELKRQGLVGNGQGQSISDAVKAVSESVTGKTKPREEFETPGQTREPGTESAGYAQSQSDDGSRDGINDTDEIKDIDLEEGLYDEDEAANTDVEESGDSYSRRGDESDKFQKTKISDEAMRIMSEGLDAETLADIKKKGGKTKGLYQAAQKYFAKKTGKY